MIHSEVAMWPLFKDCGHLVLGKRRDGISFFIFLSAAASFFDGRVVIEDKDCQDSYLCPNRFI